MGLGGPDVGAAGMMVPGADVSHVPGGAWPGMGVGFGDVGEDAWGGQPSVGVGVGGGLGAGTGRVGGQGLPWGEFEGSSEDAVVDAGWDGGADLARGEAGNNECAVFLWSMCCTWGFHVD